MDNLEKVEKLREHANVTYEEARRALEENSWDMLDAIVSLEKQGKTSGPKQSQYSTSYEQQEEYVPVKETVYDKKSRNQNRDTVKILLMKFFRICRENSFCISRYDETIIKFPVLFLLLAILIWKIALPLLIVGLFFHFRYSFEGRNDLSKVNDFMDTAGNMADRVKREFTRGEKEEK